MKGEISKAWPAGSTGLDGLLTIHAKKIPSRELSVFGHHPHFVGSQLKTDVGSMRMTGAKT